MDLYSYIKSYRDLLTEGRVRDIFTKIASGIKHCHDNNIMHRDIKPENVLVRLDHHGQIKDLKISDFGQSCKIYKNTIASGKFGTVGYMAPEVI